MTAYAPLHEYHISKRPFRRRVGVRPALSPCVADVSYVARRPFYVDILGIWLVILTPRGSKTRRQFRFCRSRILSCFAEKPALHFSPLQQPVSESLAVLNWRTRKAALIKELRALPYAI